MSSVAAEGATVALTIPEIATRFEQAASLAIGLVTNAELFQCALGSGTAPEVSTFDDACDELVRDCLIRLLQVAQGNATQVAKLAGWNQTDLYEQPARNELRSE